MSNNLGSHLSESASIPGHSVPSQEPISNLVLQLEDTPSVVSVSILIVQFQLTV